MLALASSTTSVSFLDCAGKESCRIVSVYSVVFWIAMFVLVVVGGLIIYAALRFRRRDELEPAQVHGHGRLEVAWTAMPTVILVFIFFLTFNNMNFVRNGPTGNLTIKVTGQQFAWTFQYPNGKTTATQFYIPTGQPVQLQVTSRDVLHAFWVPRLGGQVYAIPHQMNHGWIEADKPGTYLGQCNELCGTYHWTMQIQAIAEPLSQFTNWYNGVAPSSNPAVASRVSGVTPDVTVDETDALKFQPASITAKVGQVVEWDNTGNTPHNVTFNNAAVPTSSTMNGGDKYEIKFSQAGTYQYVCTFHVAVGMKGSVKVTP